MPDEKVTTCNLVACNCSCSTAKNKHHYTAEKLNQVRYGSYERNVMDVYLPANRSRNSPLVVLIHGGAWTMAGKENIRDFQDSLFKAGIAVASINHRYANNTNVHYPQMLQDIEQAISYSQAHAAAWGISSRKLVMAGVSSGAHLALLYSYTTPRKINGIVEFCGPTDLADTSVLNYSVKVGLIDVIQRMTGKTYQQNQLLPSAYRASSPAYQVKDIPVLMVHGTVDPVVNFLHSQRLSGTLQAHHIRHKLIAVSSAGHDLNLQTNPVTKDTVYSAAINWIRKYGK